MHSMNCNEQEYLKAVNQYDIGLEDMRSQMKGAVVFDSFFDDDFSWDQLFSRRAEINPDDELDERCDRLAEAAEKEGKILARDAVRSLDRLVADYSKRSEYGFDFLRHMLKDFYIPAISEERASLVSAAEAQKEKLTDQGLRLEIIEKKARDASRLSGDRDPFTLDFLEAADDYLLAVAAMKQYENLIRVMSTILAHCGKLMPEKTMQSQALKEQATAKAESIVRMAYPRRCSMTTDDGTSYTVIVSDGEHKQFKSGLTLAAALEFAGKLMK